MAAGCASWSVWVSTRLLPLGRVRPLITMCECGGPQGLSARETRMLDPAVKQKLLQRAQQLKAEGALLSRAQLERYYDTFRSRFGTEKLAGLDGEPLLNAMHGPGKDSLAYW